MPAPPISLKISDTITKYKPSKSFQNTESTAQITSLDFDDSGEFCIAASDDETLQLYDCKLGKHSKQLFSKKYGVHLAKFTHSQNTVIYASTKEDDTVRYLSLHDNVYLRYFRGHKDKVNCLEVCPINDAFLSTSMDHTLKVWDLKSPHYQGQLQLTAPLLTAFDPSGIIFAVASYHESQILLYDFRNYDKQPFLTFDVQDDKYLSQISYPAKMPEWTKLEFSNDGKHILLGTKGNAHYIVDSYNGDFVARIIRSGPTAPPNKKDTSGDVCWSPDGRYIIGGQGDKGGNVAIWDKTEKIGADKNIKPFHQLEYPKDNAACVAFNPRNSLIATAGREVVFWLPERGSGEES